MSQKSWIKLGIPGFVEIGREWSEGTEGSFKNRLSGLNLSKPMLRMLVRDAKHRRANAWAIDDDDTAQLCSRTIKAAKELLGEPSLKRE
jgi:hypothetical protein